MKTLPISKLKNLYFDSITKGFGYTYANTGEEAAIIKNLEKEIREIELPESFEESAKIMDEKYGAVLKLLSFRSQIKADKDIGIIKNIVLTFAIVYAVSIIAAIIILL